MQRRGVAAEVDAGKRSRFMRVTLPGGIVRLNERDVQGIP